MDGGVFDFGIDGGMISFGLAGVGCSDGGSVTDGGSEVTVLGTNPGCSCCSV